MKVKSATCKTCKYTDLFGDPGIEGNKCNECDLDFSAYEKAEPTNPELDRFGAEIMGWSEESEDYHDFGETVSQLECYSDKDGNLVVDEDGMTMSREFYSPSTNIAQALEIVDEWNKKKIQKGEAGLILIEYDPVTQKRRIYYELDPISKPNRIAVLSDLARQIMLTLYKQREVENG